MQALRIVTKMTFSPADLGFLLNVHSRNITSIAEAFAAGRESAPPSAHPVYRPGAQREF
jgi:hypothetical protein